MTPPPQSPYARALGERIDDLHPRLRAYFEAIPDGAVGIGEGVLQGQDVAGRGEAEAVAETGRGRQP